MRVGIGDREYMNGGGGGFNLRAATSMNPATMIMLINVAVFFLWQLAPYRFMQHHFMVSRLHMETGRVWTLVTAAFSQNSFVHLLFNMIMLFFLGRTLVDRWGARRFVSFYLVVAIFTSGVHVLITMVEGSNSMALGASGVIAGLFMCFAAYYPKATIHLMGIIPIQAWILVALGVGLDFYGFVEQMSGRSAEGRVQIGHGIHLAGSLAGALYVFVIEKRIRSRGRPRREKRPRGRVLRPDESSWQAPPRAPDPEDRLLDELLEKVSHGGLDSLSIHERETLERISEKRRSGKR